MQILDCGTLQRVRLSSVQMQATLPQPPLHLVSPAPASSASAAAAAAAGGLSEATLKAAPPIGPAAAFSSGADLPAAPCAGTPAALAAATPRSSGYAAGRPLRGTGVAAARAAGALPDPFRFLSGRMSPSQLQLAL